jgi:hypothetical protein
LLTFLFQNKFVIEVRGALQFVGHDLLTNTWSATAMAKDETSADGRRPMKHFQLPVPVHEQLWRLAQVRRRSMTAQMAVMLDFWEAAILAHFTNDDERNRYFKGTMMLEEMAAIKRRAENGADAA